MMLTRKFGCRNSCLKAKASSCCINLCYSVGAAFRKLSFVNLGFFKTPCLKSLCSTAAKQVNMQEVNNDAWLNELIKSFSFLCVRNTNKSAVSSSFSRTAKMLLRKPKCALLCFSLFSFPAMHTKNCASLVTLNFLKGNYNEFNAKNEKKCLSNYTQIALGNAPAEVIAVPVLFDNYSYLIIDKDTKKTACVDPAEPKKVIEAANNAGLQINLGICTHKHSDHSGGNLELRKLLGVDIIGSAYEETPGITKTLKDGESFVLGSLIIKAYHAPCHTKGHMLYFVTHKDNANYSPILFTGDTLFVGGCGRFFEGNAEQMLNAMNIIKSLPNDTLIYCGHEYTVNNLKFALSVEKSNKDLQNAYDNAVKKRENNQFTIPSSVEQEKRINPFMRVGEKTVRESLKGGIKMTDVEVMNELRELKNNF